MSKKGKKIIYTNDFVHMLAEMSGYTIKDSREFLYAFIKVFEYCAENDWDISIDNFGKMWVSDVPARKGYRPVPGVKGAGEFVEYPPSRKVIFSLTQNTRKPKQNNKEN